MQRLNAMTADTLRDALHRCCGSERWVERMVERRPFESREQLLAAADEVWTSLDPDDWLEAFACHPRIGATGASGWSREEQSGVADASDSVRARLAAGNDAYYERFGHVYLVCATGKRAEEMLEQLERRLGNAPETELHTAAAEQRLIMRLRLERLIES